MTVNEGWKEAIQTISERKLAVLIGRTGLKDKFLDVRWQVYAKPGICNVHSMLLPTHDGHKIVMRIPVLPIEIVWYHINQIKNTYEILEKIRNAQCN